jgi:hypothetical protein
VITFTLEYGIHQSIVWLGPRNPIDSIAGKRIQGGSGMRRVLLAPVVGVVIALVVPGAALASHARPKSATPMSFKLVPAFQACGVPDGTHGAPLTLPSCNPPVQGSEYLTLNAPDRPAPFDTAADGTGSIAMKATCVSSINPPVENGDTPPCSANAGDQADLEITVALADVRCTGHPNQFGTACAGGAYEAGAGSLYSGKVLVNSSFAEAEAWWRITDHFNTRDPNPPGADCSDTMTCPGTIRPDIPLEAGVQCSSGACNYTTSVDAVVTNMIREGHRAVLQIGQVQVWDGGRNSNLIPAPPPGSGICPPACMDEDPSEGPFLVQGLFAP